MAKNVEEIALVARDEASQAIARVAGQLGIMGDAISRIASFANPVTLTLAGIGASAGGIVLVGKSIADAVEELDRLSARTGVSVENLQVLQQQMEEAGADSGGLATAMTFLNRSIATADPLLAKLGITTRDTFSAFMQLADVFSRSNDTAKKSEIAFQLLGRGSGELIGLFPQIAEGFRTMESAMRASGKLMTGETLESARRLDAQLDDLSRNWTGALTRIKAATVPWASEIVGAFNDVWDSMSGEKADTTAEVDRKIAKTQAGIKRLEDDLAKVRPGSKVDYSALERIASINAELAKQKIAMQELLALRSKLESPEEGARRARSIRGEGGLPDALANVQIGEPDEATKSREERLKELMRVMGVTRAEAVRLAAALDAIEEGKKRADLTKALTLGPEVPKEVEDLNERIEATADVLGVSRDRARELVEALRQKEKEEAKHDLEVKLGIQYEKPAGPELPPGGVKTPTSIGEEWAQILNEIMSTATILDETLAGVFSSLSSGFDASFREIIAGTATVGSVLKTLWHSIVDAILAELARLAAAAVLKVVATALGIPGFAAVAPGGASSASSAVAQNVTNVTNVYSYDLRDGVRELASISGAQRGAQNRLAYLGEY